MDTTSRRSFQEKVAGSSTENEDSPEEDANRSSWINSLAERKPTGPCNITTPPTTSLLSSSEYSLTTPTFSGCNVRRERLAAPKMSDESPMSDEPVPGLLEKLVTATFNRNLELVCGLCNQGATDEEIAVAFTIAKSEGFNEIADELMFGSVRLKSLTQRFRKISLEIGPPVSNICYSNWRIIAEMCIIIAPPPPLSTRKAKVFFPSTNVSIIIST